MTASGTQISHFNFDEAANGTADALDPVGGLVGTFSGSATRTSGLFGSTGALLVNETLGGVNIGNGLPLESADGLTVVAVIDADWNGTGYAEIFRKEDGDSRILFCFQNDANSGGATPPVAAGPVLSFGLGIGGTYQELDLPLDGLEGRPTLEQMKAGTRVVAISYDIASGTKAIWLDGDLIYSYDYEDGTPFNFLNGGANSWIGSDRGFEPFDGVIDDLRIYDTALTAAQMQALVPDYGQNRAPVVSLTSPSEGTSNAAPATFMLSANAADSDGTISSVEFLIGGERVALATQPPFSLPVRLGSAGTFSLTAAATDNRGARTVSAPVIVTTTGSNAPPLSVTSELRLRMAADSGVAADGDGLVSEWQDQTVNLNHASQPDPLTAPQLVPDAVNGKPVLRFDGFDDYLEIGNATSLQPIGGDWTVFFVGKRNAGSQGDFPQIIGSRPWVAGLDAGWSVSLSGGGLVCSHYADGTAGHDLPAACSSSVLSQDLFQMWQVEENRTAGLTSFFNGGNLNRALSTAFPGADITQGEAIYIGREIGGANIRRASMDLAEVIIYGRALSGTERTSVSDYLSGKYALQNIVPQNTSPSITITSPVTGTSLEVPVSLTLSATVADPDGSIASVQFFRGSIPLGTDTTAPYSISLNVTSGGTATYTAMVTDNFGATTISSPVSVTFNSPTGPAGVAVGTSKLIKALQYSDSFTIGATALSPERQAYGAQGFPLPSGVDPVENIWGNEFQTWGTLAFSIATDAANFPTVSAPYPGSSGGGSATGFTQRGGGGDWSIPYGLSSDFIVQFDYVQQPDRVDVTIGDSDGIGGAGNISIFFRPSTAGTKIGIYNSGIGEFNTGLDSAIPAANEWNNYAIRVKLETKTIEVFTNQVSRGVLDLSTLKDGAYASLLTNGVVGIGGAGNDRQWSDNFQIGLAEISAPEVINFRSIVRAPGGASVTLTFDSRPGRTYAVDYSTGLNAAGQPEGWTELTRILPSGGDVTSYMDTVHSNLRRAFYRVRDVSR